MDTNQAVLDQLYHFLHQGYIGIILLIPLLFMILDIVTGVASACKRGVFQMSDVLNFLTNDGAIYFSIVAGTSASFYLMQSSVGSASALTGLVVVHSSKLVASIYTNTREFLSVEQEQALEALGQSLGVPAPTPAPTSLPQVVQKPLHEVQTQLVPVVNPSIPNGGIGLPNGL